MFIKEVLKPNGAISIRIVESVRRGNKTVQKTIRTLGQHKDPEEILIIKKAAEALIVKMKEQSTPVLPSLDPADVFAVKTWKRKVQNQPVADRDTTVSIEHLKEDCRHNDGIYDVFGTLYDQLGFDDVICDTRQDDKWNQTLEACVLARVAQPSSKMKTVQLLKEQFDVNVNLDHVYRMMDHVSRVEDRIKECVAKQTLTLFKGKVDVLLFDVTTLYFESTKQDRLRNFGFSKDCKFNQTQVVLALMTTTEGTPMGYEVFPGNTSEGKTLLHVIRAMKERYELNRVILVADRAMFNKDNLRVMDELRVQYVVAAKLKKLTKEQKSMILGSTTSTPQEVCGELHWTNEFAMEEDRRLIVSYSSDRARKDLADRNRLIGKLKKKEKDGKIRLTDVINNNGVRKYIQHDKTDAWINYDKIEMDAQWDGLHGVITNVKDETASELLSRYRDLWKIEEAFRFNKHDLKLRPIYHWKPERIRAHIAICYIAFALLSYARKRLKEHNISISFEVLREQLIKAQSSVMRDTSSDVVFSLPSKLTALQKEIYKVFGQTRKQSATIMSPRIS